MSLGKKQIVTPYPLLELLLFMVREMNFLFRTLYFIYILLGFGVTAIAWYIPRYDLTKIKINIKLIFVKKKKQNK